MAVNESMHPRNRYRQRPNFHDLVKQFPELKQVAVVDVKGKIKLDYKSKEALQLLSKCLLLRDFGLKMEIPSDKLVPALPLRLNYIHWLEDIGEALKWSEKGVVSGLDIGCGASCIYPLLAVVQSNRKWHMLAIEKDEDSLRSAKENVIRNGLEDFIDVRSQVAGAETIILEVLENFSNERFDFCMCNPPFYDSGTSFKSKNRTGKRREPSNASTGSGEELYTEGGEVQFVSQIIEESVQLKDRISVYSTMLGHKGSYEAILRKLKETSIHNITESRFCQGNTTRWAVAWSFDPQVILSQVPSNCKTLVTPKRPLKKPMELKICTKSDGCTIPHVKQYMLSMLRSIAVNVRTLIENDEEVLCEVIASENTWSHQRRKRRAKHITPSGQQQQNTSLGGSVNENDSKTKRTKVDVIVEEPGQQGRSNPPYVKAAMQLYQRNDEYFLALQHIEGTGEKDSVNQILQFMQNQIKATPVGSQGY